MQPPKTRIPLLNSAEQNSGRVARSKRAEEDKDGRSNVLCGAVDILEFRHAEISEFVLR
jgi:hypothetical protein